MKTIIITLLTVMTFMFVSCGEPEYKTEYRNVTYTVIDKESHTELNWVTELIFDLKTTKVVYNLVLQRNGHTQIVEVSQREFYSYKIGDTYHKHEYIRVKNPKYKKK